MNVAVISLGGIVGTGSLRIAGDAINTAIADYIKHKYGLLMDEHPAEAAKIAIGSAPLANPLSMELKGRFLERGLPRDDYGIRCRNPRSPGGLYHRDG